MNTVGLSWGTLRNAATALLVAAGSVLLLPTASEAAMVSGVATISQPGATAEAPLSSGGASTPFTLALPPHAACPGDTAHSGYHVYSYLVPAGTNLYGADLRQFSF